jgi:hypothetical protein
MEVVSFLETTPFRRFHSIQQQRAMNVEKCLAGACGGAVIRCISESVSTPFTSNWIPNSPKKNWIPNFIQN